MSTQIRVLTVLSVAVIISNAAQASPSEELRAKPLSDHTQRGIGYLVNQQHKDGGWGQGGGWRQSAQSGRIEGDSRQEQSDVGNTAIATLALVRAGSSAKRGEYAANIARGVEFICKKVGEADEQSLWVTDVRDTQLQMKIGRYADTFLASLALAEVKGEMPDAAAEKRLDGCLNKVVAKIERNQRDDGSFADNQGWASVLSQGLSTKALNRAKQRGAAVSDAALDKAQRQAQGSFQRGSGSYVSGGSDAGVGLYGAGAGLAGVSEAIATGQRDEDDAKKTLASPNAAPADKKEAQHKLDRLSEARSIEKEARSALVAQLDSAGFVAGFGSNGGEEFLSYMNISETLRAQGGKEWQEWDHKVTTNLNQVQNADGSWSGQHCITGRTFVTASALLVLMADRATVATASKLHRG